MELSAKAVRDLVLADHAALRVRLTLCRRATEHALTTGEGTALRRLLPGLLDHLSAHLSLEDQILAPTLRTIDAWGPERERRLARDHADQREWITSCRGLLLQDGPDASKLAEHAAEMITRIEDELLHEEEAVLDPNVLTDELIHVDFGG